MRLLHLLVGQDLLQGPGQEHVLRLLPFIHGRDGAGRGEEEGRGGKGARGTGRCRRGTAARGRVRRRGRAEGGAGKGSLGGRAAASRRPLGGSPRGEAGVGPGGGDSQPPRLREDEAFSFLLLAPRPRGVCARTRSVPEPPPAGTRLH